MSTQMKTIYCDWALDKIRRATFELIDPATRSNIRFRGPDERRFSYRFSIDNAQNLNITTFCNKLYPFVVFIRAPSSIDTVSQIQIYAPKAKGLACLALFVVSGILSTVCFACTVFLIWKTSTL